MSNRIAEIQVARAQTHISGSRIQNQQYLRYAGLSSLAAAVVAIAVTGVTAVNALRTRIWTKTPIAAALIAAASCIARNILTGYKIRKPNPLVQTFLSQYTRFEAKEVVFCKSTPLTRDELNERQPLKGVIASEETGREVLFTSIPDENGQHTHFLLLSPVKGTISHALFSPGAPDNKGVKCVRRTTNSIARNYPDTIKIQDYGDTYTDHFDLLQLPVGGYSMSTEEQVNGFFDQTLLEGAVGQ